MKKTALLSVYDKTGIVDFAQELIKLGWTLYASGGTARALEEAHIRVYDVASLVGGDAILGHRVVTLSREVHAGLLARPIASDQAELERLGIPMIDLVCVDLYPLADAIAQPNATLEDVIEQTDIGGPTMLRSAAKGQRIVVARADDRQRVIEWLKAGKPGATAFRRELASIAEGVVADYVLRSTTYQSEGAIQGFVAQQTQLCKYGENAWQTPASLFTNFESNKHDPLALEHFSVVAGTDPSFNNWAEIDRQLQTLTHMAAGFDQNFNQVPYLALGTKHGNPCGASASADPLEAVRSMVMGDSRAIFGGLVMVNFEVTEAVAHELLIYKMGDGKRLFDGVIAPSFSDDAIELLARKGGKCRLIANPALITIGGTSLDSTPRWRYVRGGFLQQPNYTFVLDLGDTGLHRGGTLSDVEQRDMVLAWAIGSTSNSNTVTLVRDGQLIGNGVGQQDRVSCCELAIKRAGDAGHAVTGAVAYSDSFFPFPDGPEVLARAGVRAIITTSGSVRDGETQALCKQHDVALYQLPDAQARGFYGH